MYLVIPFNFIPNHPQTLTQGGRASAYLSPDCKIPPVSENLFTPLQLPLQISSSGCPPLVNASTSVCLLSSSRNHYNTHQPSTPSSSSPTPPIRFFPLHKYQIPIRSNLAHIIMGRTVTVFSAFHRTLLSSNAAQDGISTVPPSTPRSDKLAQRQCSSRRRSGIQVLCNVAVFRMNVVYPDRCCKMKYNARQGEETTPWCLCLFAPGPVRPFTGDVIHKKSIYTHVW